MENPYRGLERRQFVRLDYTTPLNFKVCKKETVHKLLQGYISNVSESGILCNIKDKVEKDDILWLVFDRATLSICHDIEGKALIYQNGIIGKVIRADHKSDGSYSVGMKFLTREEKNLTHIYPKIHFLGIGQTSVEEDEQEEELE